MTMLVTEVMEGGSLHALLRSRRITWFHGWAASLPDTERVVLDNFLRLFVQ